MADDTVKDAPSVASKRAYLRGGLPAIYHEGIEWSAEIEPIEDTLTHSTAVNGQPSTRDFGRRFVGAFERVLDPIVAVLDALPAYFDPELAPEGMLELLAAWLDPELDRDWPHERRRELVRCAPELARWRGTKRGLELVFAHAFPALELSIEENRGETQTDDTHPLPQPEPGFVVRCGNELDDKLRGRLERLIEQMKPINVSYKLECSQQNDAETAEEGGALFPS